MEAKFKQSGLTLTEMVVVIAIIALLVGLGVPAGRAFLASFETESGARSMISAALASARAVAAKEQHYAGIRFQKAYHPEDTLEATQYMVFIVQDPEIGAYFFRVVEGLKPIKLPDSLGVTDFTIVTGRNKSNPVNPAKEWRLDDPSFTPVQKDNWLISNIPAVTDISTFSIIFSPSGKLVIHGIQVRNRDGEPDTKANLSDTSYDDVFNKKGDVDERSPELIAMGMGNEIGMFYQDDYFGVLDTPDYPDLVDPKPNLGLGPEPSRRSFIIYEKEKFRQAYEKGQAWSGYLVRLVSETIYINPYTGTMIER